MINFELKPLSGVLGASIAGIDFGNLMAEETLSEIFSLFYKYQVLVFRGQKLEQLQQIEACRQFGEVEMHPMAYNTCHYPEMTVISNVLENGKPIGFHGPQFPLWHSDMCYLPMPSKMTFLYAHRVPKGNNGTWFADMYQAYDDLPYDIKSKIEGRNAIFGSGYNLMERCGKRGYELQISKADIKPDVSHPVVHIHPITKRKALFINWTHTDLIEGFSKEESDELLKQIYEHQAKEKYIYKHHYQQGDLIVWDNYSLLHTGSPEPFNEPRIMHRVAIKSTMAPYYEN